MSIALKNESTGETFYTSTNNKEDYESGKAWVEAAEKAGHKIQYSSDYTKVKNF